MSTSSGFERERRAIERLRLFWSDAQSEEPYETYADGRLMDEPFFDGSGADHAAFLYEVLNILYPEGEKVEWVVTYGPFPLSTDLADRKELIVAASTKPKALLEAETTLGIGDDVDLMVYGIEIANQ